jgi:mannan endo-1,4-beta-mannosidase
MVDSCATRETKLLYFNLKNLIGKGIMFGHQDATAYGMGWKNEELRSDVNDVCGNFPAVYGWDISGIGTPYNIDSVPFERMRMWIKSAYERGGINTISWHLENLVTGTNAWDTVPAVKEILPNGSKNAIFNKKLDLAADFFLSLKSKDGTLIPILFRPFHEHTGSWFWWGARFCTPDEYKQLFRYTVTYLRDKKKVHNLIYVYSPDVFRTEENYLERFPGVQYVDVLGFDDYFDFQTRATVDKGIAQLRIIVNLANKMNKIAALTETGINGVPDSTWWTDCLLNPIKNDSIARNISWFLVWRNANQKQFFAPYPGQVSAANFIKFENDPYTIFENNLPKMYSLPSK